MSHTAFPFANEGLALFARDFDDPASMDGVIVLDDADPQEAPPEPPPPITAAMLAEACEAAREAGLSQGRAEAAAEREAVRDAMTASLLAGLRDADTRLRAAVDEAGSRLVGLVLAMLDAGFPALRARHGAAELERFTRDVVALLGQEPRIVIRIHPSLASNLDDVLAGLEQERRDAILVEPRDTLPPGDVRIAWRHGLAVRDTAALHKRLADILAPLGLVPEGAGADTLAHT